MPFGLKNTPTAFISLMNMVYHPNLDKFIIMFVDDILVYSDNEEEQANNL